MESSEVDRKGDRRIQRTKALLYEALLELMIGKGYEAITIQDLIDRANIGRSTFYYHFVDKEELLLDNIEQLRLYLREQISKRAIENQNDDFRFGFSLALLQHVQSHKMIYRATVGKLSGAQVIFHMKRMIADLAREETNQLLSARDPSNIPQEVAIEFIVNTLMTFITWWMDQPKPCPAEEVDQMFHQFVLNGIGEGR